MLGGLLGEFIVVGMTLGISKLMSSLPSSPAHFIEDMALLNVDRPATATTSSTLGVVPHPHAHYNGIRRSSSGVGLHAVGRSPLGLTDPLLENPSAESNSGGPGAEDDQAPLTAVAPDYSLGSSAANSLFPSNYSLAPPSDTSSVSAGASPEVSFNQNTFQTSGFDPLSTDPSQNGPLFMANFTQEPQSTGLYDNTATANTNTSTTNNNANGYGYTEAYHAPSTTTSTDTSTGSFYQQSNNSSYASFHGGNAHQFDINNYAATEQQKPAEPVTSSFTSFLHAPVPQSSSSLAGAVQFSGGGDDFRW